MAEDMGKALESAAKLAALKGIRRFTRFIDPAQLVLARRLAWENGVALSCWGGYEGAERVIACFHAEEDAPERGEYPLVCLYSAYSARFCPISHRDLLGAFMSLGLTRAAAGDMMISDGGLFLFVTAQTADFVSQSLVSAGKAALHFSVLEEIPPMPEPKGTAFSSVVSSLRLDAVVAAAYRLSRGEAADAIRAGLVKLEHIPCDHVDATVREGALLSFHGKGRVRLQRVDGLTRKQRIGITFFRYE